MVLRHPPTLISVFDARRNNLTILRLGLALTVLVTHAEANGFGWQTTVHATPVGEIAVDGFFVLSGFLVTRSYLSLRSLAQYAWHRFLRIMPGFWICLLVIAFVVAPLVALLEHRSVVSIMSGRSSAPSYVVSNAALSMRQNSIDGLLQDVPSRGVFDGSLWTLMYEAGCYCLVALVGVFGMLRYRRLVAAGVLGLWVLLAASAAGVLVLPSSTASIFVRFAFLFGLGALAWLYADRLPITAMYAVPAAALFVGGLVLFKDYRIIGGLGLAYLMLWAAIAGRHTWSPATDLSYGIYVYHWPMEQLLVVCGATVIGTVPFIAVSGVVAAACACLSWYLVERPALRRKNALRRFKPAAIHAAPEDAPIQRQGNPWELVTSPGATPPSSPPTTRFPGHLR